MNPITGITTDPTPFLLLAYSLGALALLGYAHWCLLQRRKLRQLLAAIQTSSSPSTATKR
jgi:hypothetical protein